MHLNRVCNLNHFDDPGLQATLRDIYDNDSVFTSQIHRKSWEVASAVMALRQGGALHEGARILGVGAGKEVTIFHLTRHVGDGGEVHATDLYVDAGIWAEHAPGQMLLDPMQCSPSGFGWVPERLIVQHMDARWLRYPDNHFDGVFTSSSIEHFGTREDVALAAAEIGRVLKPGGIASISTEWMISGGVYMGFDGVMLFDADAIQRYIVEPSDLKMMDTLEHEVDAESLATEVELEKAIANLTYPHVVLRHKGYQFTSVHLALRKPGGDDEEVLIRRDDGEVVERLTITHPAVTAPIPADDIEADMLVATRKGRKKKEAAPTA